MKQSKLDLQKIYKDSCGFGLIINLDSKASHELLETAIFSLARLSHRGAVAADGKTGDGCGLSFVKPDAFFRAVAREEGHELATNYAVAGCFLNSNKSASAHSLAWLEKELRQEELELAFVREVPVDTQYCGKAALDTLPRFVQVFINAPKDWDSDKFERHLYIARRRTELSLKDKDESFYVASMSSRMISYKGMILPHNLPNFYPDLRNPAMKTSLCLYHQRFSTNTFPEWRLAQPFRLLAHNGEINTISGNRHWSVSRESKYYSPLIPNLQELMPFVSGNGSDSMSLDNMLEALTMTGIDLITAIKILVPPAWQNNEAMDPDLRAFYEYFSLHMDPWDGPAGLVISDGKLALCSMDRNGLRPARYIITKDRVLTIASEVGVYDYNEEDVIEKGRLKPGEMLAVDLEQGQILRNEEINTRLKSKNTYKQWLEEKAIYLNEVPEEEIPGCDPYFEHELKIFQKQFQLNSEEIKRVLIPTAEDGQEPLGSMGDDTPLAVLSEKDRSLFDYFRQEFAQVTNPPIDPIREKLVMSLRTCLGREANPFIDEPENALRVELESPILSRFEFRTLLQMYNRSFNNELIDITYSKARTLKHALNRVCNQAEEAVRNGKVFIVLTDRRIKRDRVPIHALLATAAVNARLCEKGLRCDANIIVDTATARDPHHFAVLLGYGASVIHPYLAYQTIHHQALQGKIKQQDTVKLMQEYRHGIEKGLLKILSKMGISTINSYRGAGLFEAVGIHREVIDMCFPGTVSRIQGATFTDIEDGFRRLNELAWDSSQELDKGGLLKAFVGGEEHSFNSRVISTLQRAVQNSDYNEYKNCSKLVNARDFLCIRDLLGLKKTNKAIDITKVETKEKITARFTSAAMSVGAISPEAHEAIAIALNRINGRSNSGEGGEDPARYRTEKNSKIKQIASGRFGVTPEYLINAEVLQIKVAQGAKPGEGGQLPGNKVNDLIARLRFTVPGTTLISPPPHHDIYSIEDLSQLIFDLKQINTQAEVSVKLVSEPGVGTVAAGVAKAYADSVTISGHDGGTGASPISSIMYAGSPWELGLVEACHILKANDLRQKISVQVDGGFKTGLDVIKAAILGAESFGFGTAPLISLGCKFLKICHLNTCPTGIATQNRELIDKYFIGAPEMLINYFNFVAEEVRELLAELGFEKLEDIIGRTDLLEKLPGKTSKQKNIDLYTLLEQPDELQSAPRFCTEKNPPHDKAELAEQMVKDSITAINNHEDISLSYKIQNINRSIGARVSGEIAKQYGDRGFNKQIEFKFKGSAGQSFGVWNIQGLRLVLEGDANDYVGKGMAGGEIIIHPPSSRLYKSHEAAIIGNTCLYGATGGKLFASGLAGERFAVRNSGVTAVVEGLGDHGCEYMTGGIVVVLGDIGINFGAGMTGGLAFVYKPNAKEDEFRLRINKESVTAHRLSNAYAEEIETLRLLLREFVTETSSEVASQIINNFEAEKTNFWIVEAQARSALRQVGSSQEMIV
jgi:glutamate synthase (NADPH) large chain